MKLLDYLFSIQSHTTEPQPTFKVKLIADCPIYAAHFPGEPITPGVCIIGIALELAETVVQKPLVLKKIVNAKFIQPIDPRNAGTLQVTFKKIEIRDDDIKIAADITSASSADIYSRLSLLLK